MINEEIIKKWNVFLAEADEAKLSEEEIDEGLKDIAGSAWDYIKGKTRDVKGKIGYKPFGDEEGETSDDAGAKPPTPGVTAKPTGAPDSAAEKTAGKAGDTGNVLDIPGTELTTIGLVLNPSGGLLGPKLADKIDNIAKKKFGALMKNPEFKEVWDDFRSTLYPALANIDKRAHIAVGESIQSRVTITQGEMLNELEEARGSRQRKKDRTSRAGRGPDQSDPKLSKRQQAQKKGALRKKLGGTGVRFFQIGKDGNSRIAKEIGKQLKAILSDVNIDNLRAIANRVSKTLKGKDQKWYNKNYTSFLANQPEKRKAVYDENVDILIDYVMKLVNAAGTRAMGTDTMGEPEDEMHFDKAVEILSKHVLEVAGKEPMEKRTQDTLQPLLRRSALDDKYPEVAKAMDWANKDDPETGYPENLGKVYEAVLEAWKAGEEAQAPTKTEPKPTPRRREPMSQKFRRRMGDASRIGKGRMTEEVETKLKESIRNAIKRALDEQKRS